MGENVVSEIWDSAMLKTTEMKMCIRQGLYL